MTACAGPGIRLRTIAIVVFLLIATAFAGCANQATPTTTSTTSTSTPTPGTQPSIATFTATENFDAMPTGAAPEGWTSASGKWRVEANTTAPSGPNVVRQSEVDQPFPVLTLDKSAALADVDVSAKFAVLSGEKAQAGGVVFRFVDANNYYAARANGNEGNFALFHTINGNREKLMEAESATGLSTWLTVKVEARGETITVYSGATKLFTYNETAANAPKAGKVGLWTKDDSVTFFDDFAATGYSTGIVATPTPPSPGLVTSGDDDFDDGAAGTVPAGWAVVDGDWSIVTNATAPSHPNALRQDALDVAFPVILFSKVGNLTNLEASVDFSVHSGEKAQAGGIAFRFKDANNYYAARANGNEGNFALFHTIHGNREKLAEKEFPTGVDKWLNIRVQAKGPLITVYSGATKLFEYTETNVDAPLSGGVGLWTKDDSVTLFDNFEAETV